MFKSLLENWLSLSKTCLTTTDCKKIQCFQNILVDGFIALKNTFVCRTLQKLIERQANSVQSFQTNSKNSNISRLRLVFRHVSGTKLFIFRCVCTPVFLRRAGLFFWVRERLWKWEMHTGRSYRMYLLHRGEAGLFSWHLFLLLFLSG